MSFNLLESLKATFSGPLAQQIKEYLGESDAGTQSALRSIGPALLGGLMQKGSSPTGMADLYRTVTSDAVDPGFDGKLTRLMSNRGGLDPLLAQGDKLTGSVLGTRTGSVTHAVADVAGIKPRSAATLMAMAAPLVLGLFKKQVRQGSLDASGFANLLFGQRSALERSGLDDRITSALGFGSLPNLLGALPGGTTEPRAHLPELDSPGAFAPPHRVHTEPRRGRFLPWVAGLAVLLLAAWLWNSRSAREAPTATVADVSSALPATLRFPQGQTQVAAGDQRTIATVAEAIRQGDANVSVIGYTPATGNAEQDRALAMDRAAAVRDALVAQGVPESRVEIPPPVSVPGESEAERVEIRLAER